MPIKEIRRQSGLSQALFAEETGIPLATIRNWEQGRRKTPPYIIKLIQENLVYKGYVITKDRADTIDEIKNIVIPIERKHGDKRVIIFGSRARGDYNGKSDYDFFVDKGKINGLGYISFIQELEDNLHAHVDVVTYISDGSNYLKNAIDKEGVEIYAG